MLKISAFLTAVVVLTSCEYLETPTEPDEKPPLDCQVGYYENNGECVLRPDVITIQILNNPSSANCPTWNPNPASAKSGVGYRFQNTTARPYTIMMQVGSSTLTYSPLTTVDANKASVVFNNKPVGTWRFFASNCGASTPGFGTLYVTVG